MNLDAPWQVVKVEFLEADDGRMELHLTLDFGKGGAFACPCDGCRHAATAYDSSKRTWRHLDFFQYRTFIHARQPRVACPEHGVRTVEVPWARPGSGFTLLFESWCVELAKHLPVSVIAAMAGTHDTKLWRFIRHYVDAARADADYSRVESLGIDETSKKGHSYVTVVADLDGKRAIFATEGKDARAVDEFAADFLAHHGARDNVRVVTSDMSASFEKGIRENFPGARRVIDKFHVVKHMNDAVDATRKDEARENAALKGTKYVWLKNEGNLTEEQKGTRESIMKSRLKTGRALMMREELQNIYETAEDGEDAAKRLKRLLGWIARCRIPQVRKFGELLKNHLREILNYFDYRLTNAMLEGMNSVIQNVKRRARGFRNLEYFKTMIYLVCGKLPLENYLVKLRSPMMHPH